MKKQKWAISLIKLILQWIGFILGWIILMLLVIFCLLALLFFTIKKLGIEGDQRLVVLCTLAFCFIGCAVVMVTHEIYITIFENEF